MGLLDGFQNGINLGGWISQYRRFGPGHFDDFITEKDIQRIAAWGMDHVRLPVDYPILEDDHQPFIYKEDGFAYIDRCVEWCRKNNLNVVLDLHQAPGFVFDHHEASTIFERSSEQERFFELWKAFTRRYVSERKNIIFELLNEIVDATSERWNKLAHRTVEVIRQLDPGRTIMIGGNFYNSVRTLQDIELVDDPNVCYTFHFYEPLIFTHQKASWMPLTIEYGQTLEYPGEFTGLREFLAQHQGQHYFHASNEHLQYLAGKRNDRSLLEVYLQPAIDFLNKTGKELYCGEYGVIEQAPIQSRINWHRDFVGLLNEVGIARACWSYKAMEFGLVDMQGEVLDAELIRAIRQK
jgi:endoglucanase